VRLKVHLVVIMMITVICDVFSLVYFFIQSVTYVTLDMSIADTNYTLQHSYNMCTFNLYNFANKN